MKTFRTNKTILTLALAMGATLIPTLSHAQESASHKDGSYQNTVYGGRLTQIGSPADSLSPLKGFAKDLPLITVLRQITPNGWVVKKNDADGHPLDVQMPISWQGGKTWVDTLSDIASNYSLNIVVNWDNKDITLSPARPNIPSIPAVSAEPKKGIFELNAGDKSNDEAPMLAKAPEPNVVKVEPQPVKEVKLTAIAVPTDPIRPIPSWNEDSNKTLKENVLAWGRQAGYKVVWDPQTPDYPVDARVLTGDFTGNTGPIRQLAEDYGPQSKVRSPLSFEFYQNNTLVVTKWNFNQGNVVGGDSPIQEDLK